MAGRSPLNLSAPAAGDHLTGAHLLALHAYALALRDSMLRRHEYDGTHNDPGVPIALARATLGGGGLWTLNWALGVSSPPTTGPTGVRCNWDDAVIDTDRVRVLGGVFRVASPPKVFEPVQYPSTTSVDMRIVDMTAGPTGPVVGDEVFYAVFGPRASVASSASWNDPPEVNLNDDVTYQQWNDLLDNVRHLYDTLIGAGHTALGVHDDDFLPKAVGHFDENGTFHNIYGFQTPSHVVGTGLYTIQLITGLASATNGIALASAKGKSAAATPDHCIAVAALSASNTVTIRTYDDTANLEDCGFGLAVWGQ